MAMSNVINEKTVIDTVDYSKEFTPTRIFNRTIQNHKKFIGL